MAGTDTDCNKNFSSDYMLLDLEHASFSELVKILFSTDLEKRKFVDVPQDTIEEYCSKRRWIIFISILAQKFLQFVSRPLAVFGSAVEYWLNLVSSNHGVGRLALNFLRGKVVQPERTSHKFMSYIGNLDKRLDFDESIGPEDIKYKCYLSVMASKLSYENEAFIQSIVNHKWKMEFLGFFDFWNDYQEKTTTQAFILRDKNPESDLIVVAFRGTEPFDSDAWSSDIDLSWYELPGIGKVHGGFMKALGLQKCHGWPKEIHVTERGEDQQELAYYAIREMLKNVLKENPNSKFIVTGHSQGGALAVLLPSVLAFHEETEVLERIEGVYTFGQPRVGDEKFGEYMEQKLTYHGIKYHRFVYCNDIVPRLPYDDKAFMFRHFGTCIYFNSFYEGQIVEEEPNRNYFSPLAFMPKLVTSMWELIRSFVMPYRNGPDFNEGTLLRMTRVFGLIIAGIPAHCLQDYINSIKLGSPHVHTTPPTAKQGKIE